MTAAEVMVSDTAPGDDQPGQWIPIPGFSRYECWSPGGYGLDFSQWPVRHKTKGTRLKVTLGTNGYPRVQPYPDEGKPRPVEVHALIMLANVGTPGPGQQTRHLDSDPLNYRWAPGGTDEEIKAAGGNLVYGTPPENHADQVKAGTATRPEHPCAGRCGGTASFEGARCRPCMTSAGARATAMLDDGVPLPVVTRRCGYTSESWTFAVARDFGGYRGTITQARSGRRKPLLRRVSGWFRRR